MRAALFLLMGTGLFGADPNTLTPQEQAAGWKLLFDGKTFEHWFDPATKTPSGDSWTIEDGCFVAKREPRILEDLATIDGFRDFEFIFEFKLAPGGNSGIKYHVWDAVFFIHEQPGWINGKRGVRADLRSEQRGQTYTLALEFQLIDDEKHQDASRGPSRRSGSLYRFLPPEQPANAAAGQWHSGRLVVRGSHIEHSINGVRLLSADIAKPELYETIKKYWWSPSGTWDHYDDRVVQPSPIVLQNHGDSVVSFRNLKIRTL